jgi:fumarate hydratase class I
MDSNTFEIKQWQYRDGDEVKKMDTATSQSNNIKIHKLVPPISEERIREIHTGDVVEIDGAMFTGRDAMHHHMLEHDVKFDLNGAVIYHCGPVINKDENAEWKITAAGPTTSIREEPYQGTILKKTGARVVIGKGGMGDKTLQALNEHGGIYLNAIGGAAQFYAKCIKKVVDVDCIEFGTPEAMWKLEVEGFRAICTMDSHGNSLHKEILTTSGEKLKELAEKVY